MWLGWTKAICPPRYRLPTKIPSARFIRLNFCSETIGDAMVCHPHPPFRNCPQPKGTALPNITTLLRGCPYPRADQCGSERFSPLPHLRHLWMAIQDSELPVRLDETFISMVLQLHFSFWWILLPSHPYRCCSQDHSPKHFLHANIHLHLFSWKVVPWKSTTDTPESHGCQELASKFG